VISHKWSYGLANSGTAITVECESTRAQGRLDGVGNRHERWIVQDRGHEIGWPVPLRLRVGVLLILLWIVPFWALAPFIANSLSGLSNPPSDAAVTTTILVVQTILGPLGFWVARTEVKSIIKGSTKRHALGAIWSILLHGEIRGQGGAGNDPNEGRRDDA
jgi:hypothetical protein